MRQLALIAADPADGLWLKLKCPQPGAAKRLEFRVAAAKKRQTCPDLLRTLTKSHLHFIDFAGSFKPPAALFFKKLAAHLMQIDDSEQKNLRQAPEELFTRLALD